LEQKVVEINHLESLWNEIWNVILETTEHELCVSQNLWHWCEMCISVCRLHFQQLLYEVSKEVLLIAFFEHGQNFQINYAVAVNCFSGGKPEDHPASTVYSYNNPKGIL
jgi:hypothetical protein